MPVTRAAAPSSTYRSATGAAPGTGPGRRPSRQRGTGSPTSSQTRAPTRPPRADAAAAHSSRKPGYSLAALAAAVLGRARPVADEEGVARVEWVPVGSYRRIVVDPWSFQSKAPAAAIACPFLVEAPGGVEGDPGAAPDGDRHRGWPGVAAARDRPASSAVRSWPTGRRSWPRGGSPRSARGSCDRPGLQRPRIPSPPGATAEARPCTFEIRPVLARVASVLPEGCTLRSARAGDPAYGPLSSSRAVNPRRPRVA